MYKKYTEKYLNKFEYNMHTKHAMYVIILDIFSNE